MVPLNHEFVVHSMSRAVVVFAVRPFHVAANESDVRGFDITGVTTEIDLRFPQIKDECACIKACLDSKGTCNNYVYKFTDAASVESGYRACTLCIIHRFRRCLSLDSNFVLPPNVTIEFDVNSTMNVNIQPLSPMNNPQAGGLAPEAFKDKNLNTTFDDDAVSG
jgi:hypothetical protein